MSNTDDDLLGGKDRIPFLQGLSVFGALNDSFLGYIKENSEILVVDSDTLLFAEGQYPKHFYALIEGNIDMYKGPEILGDKIITLSEGECVGFISMLCMTPIPGDVVSKSGSILIKIRHETFASLPSIDLEQFSIFLMNLARDLGRSIIKER